MIHGRSLVPDNREPVSEHERLFGVSPAPVIASRAGLATASGYNQPRDPACDTRADVKPGLGPRGTVHQVLASSLQTVGWIQKSQTKPVALPHPRISRRVGPKFAAVAGFRFLLAGVRTSSRVETPPWATEQQRGVCFSLLVSR
jgi:hypothetical protein